LNNGAGSFIDSGQLLGNKHSFGVALKDVDNDRDLDAVIANNGPNEVWLNDGTGIFINSGQSLGNSESRGVDVDDLDNDGDMDIFFANYGMPNTVWFNNGTGDADNYSLRFDGTDDYVETTLHSTSDVITFAAWVKILGRTGNEQDIVCNFEISGCGLIYDLHDDNKFTWSVHINGSYHYFASDSEIQQNKWYYVVGTYDGDNGYLYVDGEIQSESITENGLITDSPYNVILGANPGGGWEI
jgi:hypothetical protein